jgi:hypothetical protein
VEAKEHFVQKIVGLYIKSTAFGTALLIPIDIHLHNSVVGEFQII